MSKVIKTFKVKEKVDVPGEGQVEQEVEYAVLEPTTEDFREGRKVYNTAFADAVNSGAVVREKMDEVLRKQGLWNDEKAAELEALQRQTLDKEKKLAEGGIKLSDAKLLAFEIQDIRAKVGELLVPRTALDTNSAQGQADNEQFNCLVSRCLVYNDTKQRRFKSYEDYLNGSNKPVAIQAANILAKHMYGVDDDFSKSLPENRFLHDFGFVNSEGQLVNKEGQLVDRKSRLVNKEGYLIDKDGNRVDENGVRVNDKGDYLVDSKPFLDDDGNEIDKTWNYGVNYKDKNEKSDNKEDDTEESVEEKLEEVAADAK